MRYPPGLTLSLRVLQWLSRAALRNAVKQFGQRDGVLPIRVGPRRGAARVEVPRQPDPPDPPDPSAPDGWEYPPAPTDWEGSDQEWWEQAEIGAEWDAAGSHYVKTGTWSFTETPIDEGQSEPQGDPEPEGT